ncbi:MAG: hypothetical protein RLP44_06775 [Aggregatilineales bacterium]
MASEELNNMELVPPEDQQNTVIARNRLLVLVDGTFVVRWGENDIQELEAGRYLVFEDNENIGSPVNDYELNQLKKAGLVDKFDDENVWLCALPERNELDKLATWEMNRVRSFYLNTMLPGSMLDEVEGLLDDLGLMAMFQPRVRDDFVVLWRSKGMAFLKVDDAEKARYLLTSKAPEAFVNTVLAFVETDRQSS